MSTTQLVHKILTMQEILSDLTPDQQHQVLARLAAEAALAAKMPLAEHLLAMGAAYQRVSREPRRGGLLDG